MPADPRILLDANVWRELCDAGVLESLESACTHQGLQLLIAPSVVYEALRTSKPATRRRLTSAMSRRTWHRLMPEAFDLANEFVREVRRLHPEWIIRDDAALCRWEAHRNDWQGASHGFWWRVRNRPDQVARHISVGRPDQLSLARNDAQHRRDEARSSGLRFETVDFAHSPVEPPAPLEGWNGDPVDRWRLDGLNTATATFGGNPYADWIGPHVDLRRLSQGAWRRDWIRFWLHEVRADFMPRWWTLTAFEILQSTRKLSSGTPCDTQLATYMFDCDLFITCDGVFHDVLAKCRRDAPAAMAAPALLRREDAPGFLSFLDMIRDDWRSTRSQHVPV